MSLVIVSIVLPLLDLHLQACAMVIVRSEMGYWKEGLCSSYKQSQQKSPKKVPRSVEVDEFLSFFIGCLAFFCARNTLLATITGPTMAISQKDLGIGLHLFLGTINCKCRFLGIEIIETIQINLHKTFLPLHCKAKMQELAHSQNTKGFHFVLLKVEER